MENRVYIAEVLYRSSLPRSDEVDILPEDDASGAQQARNEMHLEKHSWQFSGAPRAGQ